MTPESPPIVNCETRPIAKSIGVVNLSEPPTIVPIQLKIFTPVGIAISIVDAGEDRVGGRAEAGGEHVVRPDAEAEEGDRSQRVDHHRVAEERLPGEDRDDLGDDAEGRQDQDVDLGMAEHPEEVLPEERITAGGDLVEAGAGVAIHGQQDQGDRDRREGHDDQNLRDQHGPGEDRHAHHAHARSAHVEDRGDEVDAGGDRCDAEHLQADHPEVDMAARVPGLLGQWRVAVPALVRGLIEEPAHIEDDRAGQEDPVAEGVQARKRDVAGADLERHDVVEERRR